MIICKTFDTKRLGLIHVYNYMLFILNTWSVFVCSMFNVQLAGIIFERCLYFHNLFTLFGKWNIYFFFSVKNDFFLFSSFCWCDEAGSVWERLSLPDADWHCAFNALTHWFSSASSCACNKNSLPFTNL